MELSKKIARYFPPNHFRAKPIVKILTLIQRTKDIVRRVFGKVKSTTDIVESGFCICLFVFPRACSTIDIVFLRRGICTTYTVYPSITISWSNVVGTVRSNLYLDGRNYLLTWRMKYPFGYKLLIFHKTEDTLVFTSHWPFSNTCNNAFRIYDKNIRLRRVNYTGQYYDD